jgi:hypothetical protein
VSDNGERTMTRKTRNSKPSEAKPSHLGYYRGAWVDVLVDARNHYRLTIHTGDPFPERNCETLKVAHDILLEAIARHMEGGGIPLDEGKRLSFLSLESLTMTWRQVSIMITLPA